MDLHSLSEKIEKKRKDLMNMIIDKSMELTDKDIIKISNELDELIALYIKQTYIIDKSIMLDLDKIKKKP